MSRKALVALLAGAVLVGVVGVWFQPQKLVIDDEVDEVLPTALAEPVASPAPLASRPPAGPTTLSEGRFRSGEHATSGTAVVLSYPDGQRLLRLVDLSTSNGPKLKVWLSAAPAGASDGRVRSSAHLDLGGLKGNVGSQNYRVPAGTELRQYQSVVIWCIRFHVAFGSAPVIT